MWNTFKSQEHSRLVKTKYGTLVGRRFTFDAKRVDAFLGIPFAKPPIGKLRFQKPEPPESWKGVKEVKTFGPRAMQKDTFFEWMKLGKKSEDCLYLNVFSPAWLPPDSAKFAVLVFIHGDSFASGDCSKHGDVDICEHMCTKDVVVVTIQYRLGFLGFFTTGDENCPGNLALWDQTMALNWVQDNISVFNGDPLNVTVMGHAAGAVCADILSISPHSRGLFQRVILMSGSANCSWGMHKDSVEVCRKFAEELGIESNVESNLVIDALQNLPESDFESSAAAFDTNKKSRCVAPRLDGYFITKPIAELRKEAPRKPMIIGCCATDERMLLSGKTPSVGNIMHELSLLVTEKDHPYTSKKLRKKILLKLIDERDIGKPHVIARAYASILDNARTNIGIQQTVIEVLKSHEVPVFFYSLDFCDSETSGRGFLSSLKGGQYTELDYVFGNASIRSSGLDEENRRILEMTTRLWMNFVKHGDPSGADDDTMLLWSSKGPLKWEPTTLQNPQKHLSISLNQKMCDEFRNGIPLLIIETQKTNEREDRKANETRTEISTDGISGSLICCA